MLLGRKLPHHFPSLTQPVYTPGSLLSLPPLAQPRELRQCGCRRRHCCVRSIAPTPHSLQVLQSVSLGESARCLKAVAALLPSADASATLLDGTVPSLMWLGPVDHDMLDLLFVTARVCKPTHIVLPSRQLVHSHS